MSLVHLPIEILILVLSNVDDVSLVKLESTCSLMKHFISKHSLYKYLTLKTFSRDDIGDTSSPEKYIQTLFYVKYPMCCGFCYQHSLKRVHVTLWRINLCSECALNQLLTTKRALHLFPHLSKHDLKQCNPWKITVGSARNIYYKPILISYSIIKRNAIKNFNIETLESTIEERLKSDRSSYDATWKKVYNLQQWAAHVLIEWGIECTVDQILEQSWIPFHLICKCARVIRLSFGLLQNLKSPENSISLFKESWRSLCISYLIVQQLKKIDLYNHNCYKKLSEFGNLNSEISKDAEFVYLMSKVKNLLIDVSKKLQKHGYSMQQLKDEKFRSEKALDYILSWISKTAFLNTDLKFDSKKLTANFVKQFIEDLEDISSSDSQKKMCDYFIKQTNRQILDDSLRELFSNHRLEFCNSKDWLIEYLRTEFINCVEFSNNHSRREHWIDCLNETSRQILQRSIEINNRDKMLIKIKQLIPWIKVSTDLTPIAYNYFSKGCKEINLDVSDQAIRVFYAYALEEFIHKYCPLFNIENAFIDCNTIIDNFINQIDTKIYIPAGLHTIQSCSNRFYGKKISQWDLTGIDKLKSDENMIDSIQKISALESIRQYRICIVASIMADINVCSDSWAIKKISRPLSPNVKNIINLRLPLQTACNHWIYDPTMPPKHVLTEIIHQYNQELYKTNIISEIRNLLLYSPTLMELFSDDGYRSHFIDTVIFPQSHRYCSTFIMFINDQRNNCDIKKVVQRMLDIVLSVQRGSICKVTKMIVDRYMDLE